MISHTIPILNSAISLSLLLLLVFNLTQRKHLHHGEAKRYATLYGAMILLLLYGAVSSVRNNLLPPWIIPAALAAAAGLAYALRGKIFVFRRTCSNCGVTLPVSTVLYVDDNLCETCRSRAEWPYESTSRIDPKSVPASAEEVDWENWEPSETAVLCYVIFEGEVLLIHKKTGLGKGMVNAPGGRIEEGETPEEAAVRELQEEVGVTPENLYEVASLSFLFTNGFSLKGTVFFARSFTGTPRETEEADPFWIPLADIPYNNMWEDDQIWLPKALAGYYVDGKFIFEDEKMLSKKISTELMEYNDS
ncbi:MAG: NUDIX domain-containing protein [Spirochaetaceae bacterium]